MLRCYSSWSNKVPVLMKTHHKLNYEEYLLLSIKFLITGTLLHFHNSQCNFDFKFSLDFLSGLFNHLPISANNLHHISIHSIELPNTFCYEKKSQILILKYNTSNFSRTWDTVHNSSFSRDQKLHHSFVHRSNVCFYSPLVTISPSFCTLHMCIWTDTILVACYYCHYN